MCAVTGFSERSYYAAKVRPPCPRHIADEGLTVDIRRVWAANYCCYGARRVWLALARQEVIVARCTVERLMAEMGIRGVQRGSRRRTTIADPFAARAPDLVKRRFVADRPNDLWVADIERHEALLNRAVLKGHRFQFVAAGW
jgi:putative transposase